MLFIKLFEQRKCQFVYTQLKSQQGFSLVEAMVTVGILSIMALASATMIADMARENARYRRVSQRNSFEQKLVSLYQKNDLCSCNLGSSIPGNVPINVADAPATTPINRLKSGCAAATNDIYDASVAGGFPIDTNLKVTSIVVSDPQMINTTDYSATVTINYDDHPKYGSLKPGRYGFLFRKAAAATAPYPVQTCTLGGSVGGGSSAGWSLAGNGSTTSADYIGTSDNQDLIFRRNGGLAGVLKNDTTSFGVNALVNAVGASNSALGVGALNSVISGSGNVGIGLNSGGLSTDVNKTGAGNNNTYVGSGSGPGDAAQSSNQTAIGHNAKAVGNNVLVLGGTGADAVRVGIGTPSPTTALTMKTGNGTLCYDGFPCEYGIEMNNSANVKNFDVLAYFGYGQLNLRDNAGAIKASFNTWLQYGPVLYLDASARTRPDFLTSTIGNAITIAVPYNVGEENGIAFGNGGNDIGGAINFYTSDGLGYGRGGLKFKTSPSGSGGLATRLLIDPNGNVGIGALVPSEKLHIVGNLRVQGGTDCTLGNGAGGTNCTSDIRLKDNVVEIRDVANKFENLRGVEFDWNQKANTPGRHDIGVIAQDVEKIFPTAVITDEKTGYKKVDYAVLVAPLIQAVREIFQKVAAIFFQLDAQERQISSLKSEVETLKAQLSVQKNIIDRMDALEKKLSDKKMGQDSL